MAGYTTKVTAAIVVLVLAFLAVYVSGPKNTAGSIEQKMQQDQAQPPTQEKPAPVQPKQQQNQVTEQPTVEVPKIPAQVPKPAPVLAPQAPVPVVVKEAPAKPALPVLEQPTHVPPLTTTRIEIRDFAFVPMNITIKKGTQLLWEVTGKYKHGVNIKAHGETTGPQSSLLETGQNWNYTFAEENTYWIVDPVFPFMQGYVTVN